MGLLGATLSSRPLRALLFLLLFWTAVRAFAWEEWPADTPSAPRPAAAFENRAPAPSSIRLFTAMPPAALLPRPAHGRHHIATAHARFAPPLAKLLTPAHVRPLGRDENGWDANLLPGAAPVLAIASAPLAPPRTHRSLPEAAAPTSMAMAPVPSGGSALSAGLANHRQTRRLSFSTWMLLRGESARHGTGNGAVLGRSQAGLRGSYRLGARWAATARLSTDLAHADRGEAALGALWRRGAIGFIVERRQSLRGGGRNAFAVTAFGGVYGRVLPLGLKLDVDGQAGAVGLRRRAGFVEGAARMHRPVLQREGLRFDLAAVTSAAAQPGARRVDAGPALIVRAPNGFPGARIEAGWRFRVLGNARPRPGPALVIGADF